MGDKGDKTVSDAPSSEPNGLGGWLVLVAIGLVISPLRLLAFLVQTYPPILSDGTWDVLTTPASDAYHPLWAPLLVFEFIGNVAFVVVGFWLLTLFFLRSARFPKSYIWVALLNLAFIVLDAWLTTFVLPDEAMFDPETAMELARSLVAAVIWVPYMLLSRRVRNTFVAKADIAQPVAADRVT